MRFAFHIVNNDRLLLYYYEERNRYGYSSMQLSILNSSTSLTYSQALSLSRALRRDEKYFAAGITPYAVPLYAVEENCLIDTTQHLFKLAENGLKLNMIY